jgi:UDP-N-acetylmuramoylalanine--D-glutamate ligase
MRIAIIGFSREGKSVYKFLRKKGIASGDIWILDENRKTEIPRGTHASLGPEYLENLAGFDIVFRSPGVPFHHPALDEARKHKVRISSLTELFFESCPCPIIGITGSKGKSTISTLIYKLLKADGRDAHLAGNIGKPSLDFIPKLKKSSLMVLELSSFQLHALPYSPHIAVVTDMFPEHQDKHGSIKEYYDAKTPITKYQKTEDAAFFFAHNPVSRSIGSHGKGKKMAISEKGFTLFGPDEIRLPGFHGYRNAVMAAEVARYLKIPEGTILKTIRKFPGLKHRIELVRKMGNLEFYNDSASSNPQATVAAACSFPGKGVVLIAGGQDKGLDYSPIMTLDGEIVRFASVYGSNKQTMRKAFLQAGIRAVYAKDLKEALAKAVDAARKIKMPVAVILSPGATSLDMFDSYAQRGEVFKELVRKLR